MLRPFLAIAVGLISLPHLRAAEPVSFRNDVMAVLSRAGCNSGPCHGNLNGKGGFRLSLRGEDADSDLRALTREMLARRVDVANPSESLILKKAVGQVPHEGGVRFSTTSPEYETILRWVMAGARSDSPSTPRPVELTVTPLRQIVVAPADRVNLNAIAKFSDGSARNVTPFLAVESNSVGIAKVLPSGEVIKEMDGEVVLLVRYLDQMIPVRIAFIPDRSPADLTRFPLTHPIDRFTAEQFRELRITPTDRSSDNVFLRRVFLDTCGIMPKADEVRRFLTDTRPDKRERLIDELLNRPEFADYWAQKWSDLLRNEEKSLDRKGVQVFYRWIKSWIANDLPINDFAATVLTARGSTYANPPTNFYRAVRDPYQRAESVAQVFLGLRISCAKCHNHPFDRWTQDDYHRFVAWFNRIDYRVLSNDKRDMLDKHEFVGEQIVTAKRTGELPHPRGGNAVPKFLGDVTPKLADDADRLDAVAEWVRDPRNRFFAAAQANRVWFHLLGRGLVDPIDDFRATNPPVNAPLLDHLATTFGVNGYRLKPLVRHILLSETYQLSPMGDDMHFAAARVQSLEAEQLLDAITSVLDVPARFPGYPVGMRAGQVPAPPQTGRRFSDASSTGSRFLKMFGKPDRLLTCECERSDDPGMLQAFQMLTGELLTGMLAEPKNRIGEQLASGVSDAKILEEFYLSAVARFPTPTEREKLLEYILAAENKRSAWEDVVWGLVNSKEFLLRR